MKIAILFIISLFLFTGCKITGIEGETDEVEIKVNSKDDRDYDDDDYKGKGKFCPPGQAKKGRC